MPGKKFNFAVLGALTLEGIAAVVVVSLLGLRNIDVDFWKKAVVE